MASHPANCSYVWLNSNPVWQKYMYVYFVHNVASYNVKLHLIDCPFLTVPKELPVRDTSSTETPNTLPTILCIYEL